MRTRRFPRGCAVPVTPACPGSAIVDSAMSDFPSSECPPIPWRDAVQRVPLGNTAAPGPPTVRASHFVGKKQKSSRKVAANLGGGCSGAAPSEENCSKHNGNDVESWDPMSVDFHSAEFNTYDSGVGALMQSSRNGGTGARENGDITLFVNNIPIALTKDGFRNLFSRAGKVKRAHIIKPTTADKRTTFGFVDFGTVKEADAAIQMLHNFDMGDGVRLGVKVSETKENRERRMAKKKAEDEFLSTLNCGKYTTGEEPSSCANGYELTAQEMKQCETSPFVPSYKSHLPEAHSPQEPSGTEEEAGHKGEGAEGFSLGDSAGAQSLQAAAMTTQTSPSKPSPPRPDSSPSSSPPSGMCVKCGTPCKMKCIRCKTPYCSKKCQTSDWPRHRFECREGGVTWSTSCDAQPGQGTRERASSPPIIREKESSEDEGFEIPTPPLEDVMNVLQNQRESTVSKAAKRLSSDSPATKPTVSLPPQDAIVEGSSSQAVAEKTPLSLPIMKSPATKQTQALLTPPRSPSQSPVALHDRVMPKPLPLAPVPSPGLSSSDEPLSLTELLESFETASFPLPSIPLGSMLPQQFNGIVTSAVSCVRFSSVLMSVETKQALKAIKNCGLSTSLAPAEPLCLVVGSKVGYLDSNGDLYRMEVVQMPTGNDDIKLQYYDIGTCFKASLSYHRLVILPEAIVTIPSLRYKCCLDQLQAKESVGSGYFMSLVRGNHVRITNISRHQSATSNSVFYKCNAQFLDGRPINPLVVEYLKQQSQCVLVNSPATNLPSPHKPATMMPSTPPNPASSFSPVVTKPSFPLFSTTQQPPGSPKKSYYKLMHMVKDVPLHRVPVEEDFVIVPRIVDSPSSIWAHVKHPQLSNLYRMQEDLNQEYSSGRGEVYSPSVGEMCVVRYCQDKQFYRAEVLCVNNNGTVDVRFVDYGNCEMVLVSQVQHIQPCYLTLPIQALHFSLAGVVPCGHTLSWSDSAITYLKDKVLNRELTARLIECKHNSFLVSLCDPDNPRKSLADAMINDGCCEKSSDKKPDSSLATIPGVKALQSPPLLLGTPRADYHPLPPPVQPLSSSLQPSHSLSSPSAESHSVEKKILPFGQASEGGFTAKPRSPPSPNTPTTPSPPSAPSQGQRGGGGGGTFTTTSPRNPSGETGASSPRKRESPSSRGVRSLQVPNISLPCHVEHAVVVTSVVNPSLFHVQQMDHEALTSLYELTQQINSIALDPLPDPQTNIFCVAKYAEEGLLYRSKIYKRSGSTCTVKFIDYGNIEDVPVTDIYALPSDCASLPAQAIVCTLNGYRQVGKREPGRKQPEPSPDSIRDFKALVLDKQVTIEVSVIIDTNPTLFPKHVVTISMDDGEKKKDVLTAMVRAGHSHSVDPKYSPKKQNSAGGGREGGFKKWKSREEEGGGFKSRGQEKQGRRKSSQTKPWGAQGGGGDGGSGRQRPFSSHSEHCKMEEVGGSGNQKENPVRSQEQPFRSSSPTSLGLPLVSSQPVSSNFPPLSSLAVTELPSDTEYVEVIVTDATQPPILFVQLATESSFQNVSNLQSGLNSQCLVPPTSTSSSSSAPPLSHVCCCKYPVDNLWYRAAVIETQGREYVVQFIDYGNTDTVPVTNIVPCPPEFLDIPIAAVQCSLSGVCPPPPSSQWSQQAISFLQQKCYDRVLLAKVESRDKGSGPPSIQLIDTSSDKDVYISAELISVGLAAPLTPEMPTTPPPAASEPPGPNAPLHESQPVTTAAWTPVTHLPGPVLPDVEEFDVLVMSVASLTEFYIHPVTADTPHNMTMYMTSITEYCSAQATPPDTHPPIGSYCLALYSDGSWFRSKIEAVNSPGGSVDVFFVDFGNRETVSLAHIRPMAAQFVDLPIQVLQCGLYGIEPAAALDPDPATCSLLSEIATSSKMTCQVVCHCPLLVDLVSPSSQQSVRANLTSAGKLPSPPPDAVFSVQSSSLTAGAKSNVLVSEVQGPANFWVQSLDSPNISRLPSLMNTIGTYCSSWPLVAPRSPVLGELCCAKFSEDEVWYRAQVIAFLSLSECRVRFLDYGNCEVCAMSAVLPATPELLSLPALAIPCCLMGWEDSEEEGEGEGGGKSEVGQRFKSLVENQSLQAVQKAQRNGRAVVEMSGADGPIQL